MTEGGLQWHIAAKLSELEEEEPHHVRFGDAEICIVKLIDGIYAISAVCTHEFALLSEGYVEGEEIECPLHQARFNLKTGACLKLPAEKDVATYPVDVRHNDVYVGLKKP